MGIIICIPPEESLESSSGIELAVNAIIDHQDRSDEENSAVHEVDGTFSFNGEMTISGSNTSTPSPANTPSGTEEKAHGLYYDELAGVNPEDSVSNDMDEGLLMN